MLPIEIKDKDTDHFKILFYNLQCSIQNHKSIGSPSWMDWIYRTMDCQSSNHVLNTLRCIYLSVVPRSGQDSAGDIPADAPHRGAVVVELASLPDLKPAYTEITKIIALGLVYFCGHSSQFFFSHRLHSK